MRGITLGLMLAVATSALVAVTEPLTTPAMAADITLDTSKLARLPGAKETYASPATTIFTSPDSVPAAADAAAKLLAADGWQRYEDPFSASAANPNLSIMTFKKERQGLSVFVTLAPAQGNATSVSYTANSIVDDLPFSKDASEIKYAPERSHLALVTQAPLEEQLSFFRRELTARGWLPYSRRENRKMTADDDTSEPNERGKFAFFVRDNHRPLMLRLQNREDGRLDVVIEAVPQKLLTLLVEKEEPAAPPAAAAAPPAESEPHNETAKGMDANDAFNAIAGEILNEVRKATKDAMADLNRPASQASGSPAATETLAELADGNAPIPLPATAEEIDFDGGRGSLEFESASSVKSVAAFYRDVMKRGGWKADRSVIDKDNMVVLRFSKAAQDLSLTIMAFGKKTRVTASGSALATAEAEPAENASEESHAEAKLVTELTAEERSGLPVPAPHSVSGSEKSLFRLSVNATVPASTETVLAFYRRELAKIEWKEQAGSAVLSADRADVAFTSPHGPARLVLTYKNGETTSVLSLRKTEEARKSGLLPPDGKIKLLFGNMLEQDAVLTIGKTTVKIGAGLGSKKPDGPTLEIAPGKHTYSLKVSGQPAQTDVFEVTAGDIWGLMIGPGGVLPLQMY